MPDVFVDDLSDPRLADYADVAQPRRLRARGLFVAEGRLVVRRLLEGRRFRVRSVLMSATARQAMADAIRPHDDEVDVLVAPPGVMSGIVGYDVHRGCLALADRPASETAVDDVLASGRPLVVLERVVDADNIGATFRSAAAFGAAVLLSPGCCDPFYRKAVRTSLAAVLTVPFAALEPWPQALGRLREAGCTIAALVTDPDATTLARFVETTRSDTRVAFLAGTEGDGLTADASAHADVRVRIPMAPDVDSLNVATAVAIALARLTEGQTRA